ncbi:malonic semialdehyde reductase [Sandaracinobacteroides hominis]|uniref:malonic semialdehyde reductase n=1 Tax=Sandaracinobacteroides hominis TaxID=2780086 RepID=UPI0018F718C3|nr:malonic semialdehyde reductase [Sandaracinobacteroides hominis]
MTNQPIAEHGLDALFRNARTQYDWSDEPLPAEKLHALYDLLKMGPTAANSTPARFIFCTSPEARQKLADCVSEGNHDKVLQAPCTVIIGMDLEFHEQLPKLFPHADARSWFAGKPDHIRETAFRNSSLQGAWLIMAARALGLDTGPMSGFDQAKVDAAFWAGTKVETNFICSLGVGTGQKVFPRLPRLSFEDACRIE